MDIDKKLNKLDEILYIRCVLHGEAGYINRRTSLPESHYKEDDEITRLGGGCWLSAESLAMQFVEWVEERERRKNERRKNENKRNC